VPVGTAVLADWNSAVELYEREQVRIDWSEIFTTPATVEYVEMQKTGFETNQVKFRCEGRFGLAVNRPTAIVEVSLS
jgi:HK97 family phage major capsid protein